jgi:hypothetical protein
MTTYSIEDVPLDVLNLYETLAFQIIAAGYKRYSSDAILHRIRWTMKIERGDREFKCNDHWTAPLSRWFMERHPEHEGFFETRESPLYHHGDDYNAYA